MAGVTMQERIEGASLVRPEEFRLRETGRPQILTVNGKPSVVVMDAAAWREMQDQLDYAETVAGIRKGLAQATPVRAPRRRRSSTGLPARNDQAAAGHHHAQRGG